MPSCTTALNAASVRPAVVPHLVGMACRALARMYVPDERLFVFRLAKDGQGLAAAGLSRRYTAIALIGMTADGGDFRTVLGTHTREEVCDRLVADLPQVQDLGEVALIAWATLAMRHDGRDDALARLAALRPDEGLHPLVESCWALAALTFESACRHDALRRAMVERVSAACNPRSRLFGHTAGGAGRGLRAHVACFADFVYPIHALALHARGTGDARALALAATCAERVCALQGQEGQWWWHYDHRTGRVLEQYPVYAIHQDAMAPMALLALAAAGGPAFDAHIDRGLGWLAAAPELDGRSLIDPEWHMVWRKVARHEPGKTTRYLQAAVSRVSEGWRAPGVSRLFPPDTIDYEDRPYHWGWLLYAWAGHRFDAAVRGASRP
jgi:hypothetical protein